MKNKLDKEINKKELNEVISLSKKILKILYIVFVACLILTIIFVCKQLNVLNILLDFFKVISPFFIGFVIAWLLRPLVIKLSQKIHNHTISSLIVFSSFILILFLVLYIFIPTIYNEVNELVGLLPGFIENITNDIKEIFTNFEESGFNLGDFPETILANIKTLGSSFASSLPNTIINFIIGIFSGIGTFAMSLIIGIYMLIDYDNIMKYFQKLVPKRGRNDVHELLENISNEVRKCVYGTFLVAFVVLVCDSIGFALVGLNAPVLFGLFCGLTDLIPFIGPYIGGAAAVIVGLTQDPLIGIGALIICFIVQIVENYILQPIIMSKASNLHPVVIIIALLVFGHFFGILGMILATSTLTILKVLITYVYDKLKLKKII